jgi:hypothetical protein
LGFDVILTPSDILLTPLTHSCYRQAGTIAHKVANFLIITCRLVLDIRAHMHTGSDVTHGPHIRTALPIEHRKWAHLQFRRLDGFEGAATDNRKSYNEAILIYNETRVTESQVGYCPYLPATFKPRAKNPTLTWVGG